MCSNFYPTYSQQGLSHFSVDVQQDWGSPIDKMHVFNHYPAPIVRLCLEDGNAVLQLLKAEFGLLPAWSKERKLKFATMNARSETVGSRPTFCGAWSRGQKCIIPADAIVEPDWRSGRHIPAHIARADGKPMGIAGLWDLWKDRHSGERVFSFTMLTINADGHEVMQHFHKPNDEKRMVVILDDADYQAWLSAPVATNHQFMQAYPASKLNVMHAPPLSSTMDDLFA